MSEKKLVEKACSVLSLYGLDKERNSCALETKVLEFCSVLGKSKFGKCVRESAVLTRKKIAELRKKLAPELSKPVTDEIVERVIKELEFAGAGETTLAQLKDTVVKECASVSKTVDDLLTCIDESQKITWALSSEL